MQAVMEFHMTTHFINQNPHSITHIETMLNQAYVVKARHPAGNLDSLLKAARDSDVKIYAYYKTRKQKWGIVIGRDYKTGAYNMLVTIYKVVDNAGWMINQFQRIPVKKRQLLHDFLKFKRAVVHVNKVQPATPVPTANRKAVNGNLKSNQPVQQHTHLTVRELGYKI